MASHKLVRTAGALAALVSGAAPSARAGPPAKITHEGADYLLYPVLLEEVPPLDSPLVLADGTEVVTLLTGDGRAALARVTVENGEQYVYARGGKGRQLEVAATDFPTLARTGLHSEIELEATMKIGGRSVAEITEIGRPGMASEVGFLAADEDIVSVLLGDNRSVRALDLSHPELARPLFHVWNAILEQLAAIRRREREWGEIVGLRYGGREVEVGWETTRGWQESIFDDEIIGGCQIRISRPLDPAERSFLDVRYSRLDPVELERLITDLSSFRISEMVPFYIQRYGFYEGYTDYRADPLAIALVFGLRSLEAIDEAFAGRLDSVLDRHFHPGTLAEGGAGAGDD